MFHGSVDASGHHGSTGQVDLDITSIAQLVVMFFRGMIQQELAPLRAEIGALAKQILGDAGQLAPGASRRGPWLTPDQIAEDLGIAVATVWTWIRSGALPASQPGATGKKGRLYFVHRDALDDFLRKHVTTGDAAVLALRPVDEATRIMGRLAARSVDKERRKPARAALK